jgi:hypothetical protein
VVGHRSHLVAFREMGQSDLSLLESIHGGPTWPDPADFLWRGFAHRGRNRRGDLNSDAKMVSERRVGCATRQGYARP